MISSPVNGLDLRGTPCPLNYVRCRLALEQLFPNDTLEVFLDKGEPEEMVTSGLQSDGHNVEVVQKDSAWVKIMVICGAK